MPTPEPAKVTMIGRTSLVAALIRARRRHDRRDYSVFNEHIESLI